MHETATAEALNVCTLVYAGTGDIHVPDALGVPRADQLLGSPLDRLIELAGRTCYDSLGSKTSRDSAAYHEHVNDVRHHSTHEHANLTFEVPLGYYEWLLEALVGRPGVHLDLRDVQRPGRPPYRPTARLTLNLRTIREWDATTAPGVDNPVTLRLGRALAAAAAAAAPLACGDLATASASAPVEPYPLLAVPPVFDEEVWVSLYLENVSRGLTHELVRHKFRTAVSQRSTRFVDESSAAWIPHPLILRDPECLARFHAARGACNPAYDALVAKLQADLRECGLDATAARKQARGAARGVLGNALESQLIFSASIAQWKWIARKRASNAADAEIRLAICDALGVLRRACPDRFSTPDWDLLPARDGVGSVVRCED